MATKIFWIPIMCILAASCQKREYEETRTLLEKEDIFCSGSINGEPLDLKIGTDNYYCYSSYFQGKDSVYLFEGNLKKYGCNPCNRALRISLLDYTKRLPGASIQVDSVFRTGSRRYVPPFAKIRSLKFMGSSNKDVTSWRWSLNNEVSFQNSEITLNFDQPGLQTVSLTMLSENKCESSVINKIDVSEQGDVFACGINVVVGTGNSSGFSAQVIGGKAPFNYSWIFGDNMTNNVSAPTHVYQYAGAYPVKLGITDANGKYCESNIIHVAGKDLSSCSSNISIVDFGIRSSLLNNVKIQWIDQSNAVFASELVTQPAGSYFEILNSQPYEENEKGDAGRLLTMRFNVLLSDGTRQIWFKSENAALVVAYK